MLGLDHARQAGPGKPRAGRGRPVNAKMVPGAALGVLALSSAARGLRRPLRFRCVAIRAFRASEPVPGELPAGWAWYEALAASAPVACAETGLAVLQAASGLPWWATVVAASAALRTGLTLPLAAQQSRVLAKVSPGRRRLPKRASSPLQTNLAWGEASRSVERGWGKASKQEQRGSSPVAPEEASVLWRQLPSAGI